MSQSAEELWQALPDSIVKSRAGIHFYTLNRSDATRTIFDSLGIPRQRNKEVPIT